MYNYIHICTYMYNKYTRIYIHICKPFKIICGKVDINYIKDDEFNYQKYIFILVRNTDFNIKNKILNNGQFDRKQ